MKKYYTLSLLLLGLMTTIISCGPKEEEKLDITGTYAGNISTNAPLKIEIDILNISVDTTFSTMNASSKISEHFNEDSLMLEVTLTIEDKPIPIEVPAYRSSENTLTIENYNYNYLNVLKMIVNGTATVVDNKMTAQMTLTNGDNEAGRSIEGDISYEGTK